MASTRACLARPSLGISALSPALARIKGMAHTNEMLDVVDFGVSASRGQEAGAIERRLKHPARLAIKRSEIKSDGGRKRWHCDKGCKDLRRSEDLSEARASGAVGRARKCVLPDVRCL
jgi:hypothetical protein